MHRLLKRQLKRYSPAPEQLPSPWQPLIEAVDDAYQQYDTDHTMLERSLELSSEELLQANSQLEALVEALPDLFIRLSKDGVILDYKGPESDHDYLSLPLLIGGKIHEIPHQAAAMQLAEGVRRLEGQERRVDVEYQVDDSDERSFYEARLVRMVGDQIMVIVRDISEREETLQALSSKAMELETSYAELSRAAREREEKQRLKAELDIGAQIQTSILPQKISAKGLELDAMMVPATEVGGDYYDVYTVEDGAWIAIGDVAGHGLTSGLVMLMAQSSVAGLVRSDPTAAPRDVVAVLNEVLYDNIRNRLGRDEFVTLTLLRYHEGGRLVFAGAHEEIILWRQETQSCELVQTPGTWLGAMRDIRAATVDTTIELCPGDLLVLYTDGVTEGKNEAQEQFGIDRICALIDQSPTDPVDRIRRRLWDAIEGWTAEQDDDVTLVVLRYIG